jgi:hypothetical protein
MQRTESPRPELPQQIAQEEEPITVEQAAMESEQAQLNPEPIPIDTTAELLGRANAKPRRPRTSPASRIGASAARGTRKTAAAARKPAARRTPRAGKAAARTEEGNE